ncbi:MAG: porin family protein [Brevundimonas sp.]|nr:porin family protein [Brevundimonas sp.]
MKTLVLASSAAAALALSAGAASAEPNGWYGAIDAGWTTLDDVNIESATTAANIKLEADDGWAAFARLGYRFNPNWRVELEGGYRKTDLSDISPATGGLDSYDASGDIAATTVMANVIYDIGSADWGIRPFVGLGAGVNYVDTTTRGILSGTGEQLSIDDSNMNFAAQAIAGLAWAISDRANVDLTYRYLTGDAEFKSFSSGTDYGVFDGDYDQSHTVTLGLRYSFGADVKWDEVVYREYALSEAVDLEDSGDINGVVAEFYTYDDDPFEGNAQGEVELRRNVSVNGTVYAVVGLIDATWMTAEGTISMKGTLWVQEL